MANQRLNILPGIVKQWYICDLFGYIFMETM